MAGICYIVPAEVALTPPSLALLTTFIPASHRSVEFQVMEVSVIVRLVALVEELDTCEVGEVSLDVMDGFRWRLEMIYRELLAKEASNELHSIEEAIVPFVSEAYCHSVRATEILEADDSGERGFRSRLTVPRVCSGGVGRPSFQISKCVIAHLLDNRLSVPKIAEVLDVSVSTVRRRMVHYGLSVQDTYAGLRDTEVDELVMSVNLQFPTWGVRQMYGYLISQVSLLSGVNLELS